MSLWGKNNQNSKLTTRDRCCQVGDLAEGCGSHWASCGGFSQNMSHPHAIPHSLCLTPAGFILLTLKLNMGNNTFLETDHKEPSPNRLPTGLESSLKEHLFSEAPGAARPQDALFLVTVRLILEASASDMLPFSAH